MEREVARCEGFDIIDDEHGGLGIGGCFNYGGSRQGFGYRIEFVRRFMAVFRVNRLQDVNGKACWVTHDHCSITLIEPLLPSEGTSFDLVAWSNALKGGTK